MKKVAILIDGGFISKVYKKRTAKDITADAVIRIAHKTIDLRREELFRIYYYDAPPSKERLTNPLDSEHREYFQQTFYDNITNFHRSLAEKDFVALRLGHLYFNGWKLSDFALNRISRSKTKRTISASDIVPDFKQKAVDMTIGLDIAWLATKRIVDTVMLITADNDFIPAMKFARKEGLHVAIARIGNLNSEMMQHSDRVINIDIGMV